MTPPCWQARDAERLLGVDAGPPDDVSDAGFLATHVPWSGRRLHGAIGNLEEARRVTDVVELHDVGDELFAEWGRDEPVVWVHGSPGTGKSHLVRHLYLQAEQWVTHGASDTDAEELIFVPKSAATSLKAVLELILRGRSGQGIERLRDSIRNASEGITEAHAAKALFSQLAFLVDVDLGRDDWPQQFEERHWRRGEREVAERLREFLVSNEVWAQATDEDCFASRIAAIRLGRVSAADRGDHDLEVTPALLPLAADAARLGGGARELHDMLVSDTGRQEAACRVLNYHLDRAVQKVFGIDSGLVTDAALELRRLLRGEGKRLWLFFEDFAVLQGIQGELLDVFTSMDADLCDLRVVAAITPGPFQQLPQMIFGRTRETVDLDVPMTDADRLRDELVVRYLNAVRVGDERLRATTPQVENACARCPFGEEHRDDCFGAFGTMRAEELGEVSLFPFTSLALDRAVRKVNPGDGEQVFNPRFLLTRVLRPVLRAQHGELERGSFPSDTIARDLTRPDDRLPAYHLQELSQSWSNMGHAEAEVTRGVAATLLYGPYNGAVARLLALPPHTDGLADVRLSPPPVRPGKQSKVQPTDDGPQEPLHVAELRRWSQHRGEDTAAASLTSATLTATRRTLRTRILDDLAARTGGPGATAFDEHLDGVFRDVDIVIDGQDRAARTSRFDVQNEEDGALVALMWDASAEEPPASMARNRPALDRLLERGQRHVQEVVLDRARSQEATQWLIAHWVVAHSALAGRVPVAVPELLEAPAVSTNANSVWREVLDRASKLHEACRGAISSLWGYGIGEIVALDAVAISGALAAIDPEAAPDLAAFGDLFPKVGDAVHRLAARLGEDDVANFRCGAEKFHALVSTYCPHPLQETIEDLRDLRDAMLIAVNSGHWQLDHLVVRELQDAGDQLTPHRIGDRLETWRSLELASLVPGSAPWVAGLARHDAEREVRAPVRVILNNGLRFVSKVDVEVPHGVVATDFEGKLREQLHHLNRALTRYHHG
jgi:hypothetical protein